MRTRNWIIAYAGNMVAITTASKGTCGKCKNTQGQVGYYRSTQYFPWQPLSQSYVTNLNSAGIMLGSGTTAPSVTDYKLDNLITSGLSCTISVVYDVDSDFNPYKEFVITATNTSGNPITVSEAGLSASMQCATTKGGTTALTYSTYLVERSLLDTPVTIPAGGVGVIKYRLTLPLDVLNESLPDYE